MSISIVKKQYLQLHLHAVSTDVLVSLGIEFIFFLVTSTVLYFVDFIVDRSRTFQFSGHCPRSWEGALPVQVTQAGHGGIPYQKASCVVYSLGAAGCEKLTDAEEQTGYWSLSGEELHFASIFFLEIISLSLFVAFLFIILIFIILFYFISIIELLISAHRSGVFLIQFSSTSHRGGQWVTA